VPVWVKGSAAGPPPWTWSWRHGIDGRERGGQGQRVGRRAAAYTLRLPYNQMPSKRPPPCPCRFVKHCVHLQAPGRNRHRVRQQLLFVPH
jgi:hypothetical protein